MSTAGTASESARAVALYALSPYRVAPPLLRNVARVKQAAAACNGELGYLESAAAAALQRGCRAFAALEDDQLSAAIPLDAYAGGAGTSINMAVNQWLVDYCDREQGVPDLDPHAHANLHQSTNDVMPTALRLTMHDMLVELEASCEQLQGVLQNGEERYDAVLKPARTQLREALVTTLGREFATWAHAIGRDRWRCFKARERIREVNLGGTAIGSGAGAPRRYVLTVIRHLQQIVDHPISRAEHLTEATSNYDQVVEAADALRCVAVDLRRIAQDLRLLSSGPRTAIGELTLPALLPGSSIMAGKVNPVIPEAVIQSAERILANDGLLTRLASMSELELNAFFPAIAHTVYESLYLADHAVRALAQYVPQLVPDSERCSSGVTASFSDVVALLPLLPYDQCALLGSEAVGRGVSVRELLEQAGVIAPEDGQAIFAAGNLTALGYDEALYDRLRASYTASLHAFVTRIEAEAAGQ